MKAVFSAYKKYIIWLMSLAIFAGVFAILRSNTEAMDYWVNNISGVYRQAFGKLTSYLPFSLAEMIWAIAILCICAYIIAIATRLISRKTKGRKMDIALRGVMSLVCVLLSIYAGFTLMWGADYYATPFEVKEGLISREISTDELYSTTELFVQKLNETSRQIKRSDDMLFAYDTNYIFKASDKLYDTLVTEYSQLKRQTYTAKPMLFSRVLSLANFTGFYFPFTGESTVNIDQPAALIPSTIAHELAHQMGVVQEDMCNYLAIRACEDSDELAYNYSGLLFGYIHLSNALYLADNEKCLQLAEKVDAGARADITSNNVYWQKYETHVATVTNAAYEGFLQGYGETDGMASYGKVVDLLVEHYAPK